MTATDIGPISGITDQLAPAGSSSVFGKDRESKALHLAAYWSPGLRRRFAELIDYGATAYR